MLRLILVTLFVLVVLAFYFLPLWVNLTIGVLLIVLAPFLLKRLALLLFTIPFRAKGKVLRNATVEVHSIRPRAAPPKTERLLSHEKDEDEDDDEEEERPTGPRDYYEVEVTVTPKQPTGPFMHWEYGELMLVRPGAKWDETSDDEFCSVQDVSVVRDGTVLIDKRAKEASESEDDEEDDDGPKVFGPHRLKMLIGVKPGVRELMFKYYFENLGKLQLPGAT